MADQPTTVQSRAAARIGARIGVVASPILVILLLPEVVGALAAGRAGFWWGIATAVLVGGVPIVALVLAKLAGRVSSVHLPEAKDRASFVALSLGCLLLNLLLLWVFAAPVPLIGLLLATGAGLVVTGVITKFLYKISFHASSWAGAFTLLTLAAPVTARPALILVGVLVVAVICWARVASNAHRPVEVVTGSVVGVLTALIYLPWMT